MSFWIKKNKEKKNIKKNLYRYYILSNFLIRKSKNTHLQTGISCTYTTYVYRMQK